MLLSFDNGNGLLASLIDVCADPSLVILSESCVEYVHLQLDKPTAGPLYHTYPWAGSVTSPPLPIFTKSSCWPISRYVVESQRHWVIRISKLFFEKLFLSPVYTFHLRSSATSSSSSIPRNLQRLLASLPDSLQK